MSSENASLTAASARPATVSSEAAGAVDAPAFSTNLSALIARLGLALVIFPHGAQKVLGWFGGWGFSATFHAFTQQMHIPAPLALLAIASEFLGSLGLATGLLTRLSAFGIGVTMTVAALTVHIHNGYFMNWTGQQKGEGVEFFVLAIALALVLLIRGGGRWSLDTLVAKKLGWNQK